jgi:tetratricopeptide (TPR) repeat protein
LKSLHLTAVFFTCLLLSLDIFAQENLDRFELGKSYLQSESYQEAADIFEEITSKKPSNPSAWNNLGVAYYHLGKVDSAIEMYGVAISLDSVFASAYNNRGIAQNDINNWELATIDYNKAIDLEPTNSAYWNNRGVTFQNLNQFKSAIIDFETALRLGHQDGKPVGNLAFSYKEIGNCDSVVKWANVYLEKFGSSKQATKLLTECQDNIVQESHSSSSWNWKYLVGLAIVVFLGLVVLIGKKKSTTHNTNYKNRA